MANITVSANTSTISVNQSTNTVTVSSTPTTVSVGTAVAISNTDVRAALSNTSPITYNSTTGVIGIDSAALFTGKTTTDLAEGTNLYYTNARVQSYVVDSGLDFNAEKVDDQVANLLVGGTGITLTYDDAANTLTIDGQVGDIQGVTAGDGLTGGGTSGTVTLNVGAGTGLQVNPNDIEVTLSGLTTDNLTQGSTNKYLTTSSFESTALAANVQLKEFRETTVAKGNINGAVSFDQSTGTQFTATLTGNITALTFPDIQSGTTGTLFLTQDAVGNRGFDNVPYSGIKFANDYSTLSTNPGNVDVVNYIHDGTTTFLNITNIESAPLQSGDKGQKGEAGATGPTGPQGPQGPQGTAGDKGQKGEVGAQGPQGAQGPTGAQGPQGNVGVTGPTGPQGNVGVTGPQGTKGQKGELGPQGTQGPSGPQGATGPTGPQGPAGSVGALDTGKIFVGSTSNTSIEVTPQNNFVTTSNAFNLSNSLTDVNSITSEASNDILLKGKTNTKINTFVDDDETEGLTFIPKGRAIKSTRHYRGATAFYENTSGNRHKLAGMVILNTVNQADAGVYFKAGSNVVHLKSIFSPNFLATGSGIEGNIVPGYANGMVLMNPNETTDYQSFTYPLSDKAFTVGLANSDPSNQNFGCGEANIIMSEPSPVDFVWQDASFLADTGLFHALRNSDGDQITFSAALDATGNIGAYMPADKNAHIVSDTGKVQDYSGYTLGSLANLESITSANVSVGLGFPTSSAFRSTKTTQFSTVQGSPTFSNIVLIGNNARYDDTMKGHIYYPSFGINTVWDGVQDLAADTGTTLTPPISTGLRFLQFTDQTSQDASNPAGLIGELSTGGARMLLGTANSNVTVSEAHHRPVQHQGLGVYGFFGVSEQEVAPRTRSVLPGGIYAVASETWTANTGTDMYFVSTPQGKKGIDTDNNAAHMFLASNNGETTVMGTNKVSFYQSANAFNSGNIVAGYNDIKVTTEWANISGTGIQTGGAINATGNIIGNYLFGNASQLTNRLHGLTTDDLGEGSTNQYYTDARSNSAIAAYTGNMDNVAQISPDTTVLKQFNESVVSLGNQSGNIAALAAFNAANASIFTLTATGGITISEIPNAATGSSYTIKVIQDGTGSHALTSTFKFAGGDKTLSTAASSIDVISVVYDGTDYLASLTKAYA